MNYYRLVYYHFIADPVRPFESETPFSSLHLDLVAIVQKHLPSLDGLLWYFTFSILDLDLQLTISDPHR